MRRSKSKTPSTDSKHGRTPSGPRIDWVPPHPALGAQVKFFRFSFSKNLHWVKNFIFHCLRFFSLIFFIRSLSNQSFTMDRFLRIFIFEWWSEWAIRVWENGVIKLQLCLRLRFWRFLHDCDLIKLGHIMRIDVFVMRSSSECTTFDWTLKMFSVGKKTWRTSGDFVLFKIIRLKMKKLTRNEIMFRFISCCERSRNFPGLNISIR